MAEDVRSRNLEQRRALAPLKGLLEDQPLVFDREFSYEGFLEVLVAEGLQFVIRLNTGIAPTLMDEEGQKVVLTLTPGKKAFYKGLLYKGKVSVNVAGWWRERRKYPLWVVTNLEPAAALGIYQQRVKIIEESFRDLKSLLGPGKSLPLSEAKGDEQAPGLSGEADSLGHAGLWLGAPGRESDTR